MIKMIEQALSLLGKQLDKKAKIPTWMIVCAFVLTFILGVATGAAITKLTCSKKVKTVTDDDDFDAEEYLRNLELDDEE